MSLERGARPESGAPFDIVPARKIAGRVTGLFAARGDGFETVAVAELPLTFEGIPGDVHGGHTRRSGGREPWYARGTEMANERQLSILADEELAEIAALMDLDRLAPEWIGANMTVAGIAHLTMLPPRTTLFFEGGATLRIDGDNAPCRLAGRSIAQATGRKDAEMAFPKLARHRRGLVAWVEKPGSVRRGEAFEARVPPQWIWQD